MLDKESGNYEGHDIDLAKLLASEMGVEVEFVPTTWSNLMKDYEEDKYDIAVGGITQRVSRVAVAAFLPPYAPNGKVALIRKEDKDVLTSLEAMDVPERTVIVNPGGTNEKFVNANFKNAKVQVHPENAEIPGMIAEGKGDIMITETFEAAVYARKDHRLEGAFMDKPLTRVSFMGYLSRRMTRFYAGGQLCVGAGEASGRPGNLDPRVAQIRSIWKTALLGGAVFSIAQWSLPIETVGFAGRLRIIMSL